MRLGNGMGGFGAAADFAAGNGRFSVAVADGKINNGTANAFKRQPSGVTKQIDKGNTSAACSQLQEFIDDVQAQIDAGNLDPADGQPLIDSANNLRATLGC